MFLPSSKPRSELSCLLVQPQFGIQIPTVPSVENIRAQDERQGDALAQRKCARKGGFVASPENAHVWRAYLAVEVRLVRPER